jgi:hypothetical protein
MSDWTTTDIKQRCIAATEYRGYANIPVGDDTYSLPYRLLDSDDILDIQGQMDISAVAEHASADVSDEVEAAEETIEQLQAKDELTDAEEADLRDAQTILMQNRGELMDAIGADTLKAFAHAGRMAIAPDEEDVNNVMNNPTEAMTRFADIEGAPPMNGSEITREQINRALEAEMKEIIDSTPFLIFYTLGQQVWEESQNAGNVVGGSDE